MREHANMKWEKTCHARIGKDELPFYHVLYRLLPAYYINGMVDTAGQHITDALAHCRHAHQPYQRIVAAVKLKPGISPADYAFLVEGDGIVSETGSP